VVVGVGVGMVEVGDLDDKRRTDAPTARWAITPPKHAASGSALTVEMSILAETAIPVEMTALEETMMEEAMRQCATIAGSLAISDPTVFTTNEQRKHKTKFAKAQLQSPPVEIEIASEYPAMLSPPPPLPIQLGSLIPGPLTLCATIAARSGDPRNYGDPCSLNLVMITR